MPGRPRIPIPTLRRYAHIASNTPAAATAAGAAASAPPMAKPSRVYTPRKTFLHPYYTHLLTSSQATLLFAHDNLSVSTLSKIRQAILAIPPPPSLPTTSTGTSAGTQGAILTIARTGLLSSLTKRSSPISSSLQIRDHLKGPTALLTCSTLSPSYVSKILLAIQRVIKKNQKEARNDAPPPKQPRMELIAGILEGGKVMSPNQIVEVGKLPELATLRAQLVGLLESPGRNLVGLLGQAAGGGLVRTLQGLEKDLQDKQGSSATPPPS